MEVYFSKLAGDNYLLNLLVLGRPWNGIVIGMFSLLGYLLAGGNEIYSAVFLFLAFFLQYFGGTILNDLSDLKSDEINMPFRPLSTKVISTNQAKFVFIASYISSFLISLYFSFNLFIGTFLFFLITMLYSVPPFRLVGRGFLGNISLGVVSIFVPAMTGFAVGKNIFTMSEALLFFFVFLTLFFSFFYLIKDFKDLEGDKKSGKKTFVLLYGVNLTIKLSIIGSIIFFTLAILSLNLLLNSNLLLIISAIFLTFFIYYKTKLFKSVNYQEIFTKTRLIFMGFLVFLFMLIIYK